MSPEKVEWIRSTGFQAELSELMKTVVFRQALALAQEELETDVDLSDASTIEKNAILHAQSVGARKIIQNLKKLASPPKEWFELVKEVKPLPEPYDYLKKATPVRKTTVA